MDSGRGLRESDVGFAHPSAVRLGPHPLRTTTTLSRSTCSSRRSSRNVERPRLIGSKPSVALATSARHGAESDSKEGQTCFKKLSSSLAGVRYERGGLCVVILEYSLGKGHRSDGSDGKFVVLRTREAYDAQGRVQIGKSGFIHFSRLGTLRESLNAPGTNVNDSRGDKLCCA